MLDTIGKCGASRVLQRRREAPDPHRAIALASARVHKDQQHREVLNPSHLGKESQLGPMTQESEAPGTVRTMSENQTHEEPIACGPPWLDRTMG